MKNQARVLLVVALAWLVFSPPMRAQAPKQVPRTPDGKPNFSDFGSAEPRNGRVAGLGNPDKRGKLPLRRSLSLPLDNRRLRIGPARMGTMLKIQQIREARDFISRAVPSRARQTSAVLSKSFKTRAGS